MAPNQSVIDRAVNIATRSALSGFPLERIVWIPPCLATSDSGGVFVLQYPGKLSASIIPTWDR